MGKGCTSFITLQNSEGAHGSLRSVFGIATYDSYRRNQESGVVSV